MSDKTDTSEKPASSLPKLSGIKPPSSIRSSHSCCERKPDLPLAATPGKHPNVSEESEYELWSDRFGSWIGRDSSSRSPEPLRYLRQYRKSGASSASPDFFEATGRRCSSDNGNDLTTDTDSFMIGQRVFVGGVKPGRITFIGEVHFAPGDWAGVVLDEPEGKNDGSVSGKRYFQCEPKKGIFSRLPRLTREPLASASTPDGMSSLDMSYRSMTPARSGTTSPSYSTTSVSRTPFGTKAPAPEINDRIIVKSASGSRAGLLRFKGEPSFASGIWCGVEFDEPVGKNDGTVGGRRYFECEPNHGLFVPESKVSLSPLSRKARLSRANSQESLASNITLGSLASTNTSKLRFSSTQKRLSALNKSPSATSTTKPSFSLQDILREKSNHIEQLMKEREQDREESAAQAMLFKKNVDLFKDKIVILTTQLEEERKRSEDLQFAIDENAATTPDDSNVELRQRITQLEKELKRSNTQAGGDFVPASGPSAEELEKLRNDLREATNALQNAENAKNAFEMELKMVNETLSKVRSELDDKSSGAELYEKESKSKLQSLEQQVGELEVEHGVKLKEIEANLKSADELAQSKDSRIVELEAELKRLAEAATQSEAKDEVLTAKDAKISELNEIIAKMTVTESEAVKALADKEVDLVRLFEKETLLNGRLQQLEETSNEKTENLTKKELELATLRDVLTSIESEFQALQKTSEQQAVALDEKLNENEQLALRIVESNKEVTSLKENLERMQDLTSNSDESLKKSFAIEEELKSQIQKLSEAKSSLETEIISKDSKIQDSEAALRKSEAANEAWKVTISELETKLKELNSSIADKTSTIETLEMNFKKLEENSQKSLNEKEIDRIKAVEDLKFAKVEFEDRLQSVHETLSNECNKKVVDLLANQTELMNQKDRELKELNSKLIDMARGDEEKVSQIQKLQKSLEELSSKLQHAEQTKTEEATRMQEEKQKLELDKNELNRILGVSDEKIKQLNDLKVKLEKELEDIKHTAFDSNTEMSKMNIAMKEIQTAYDDYQQNSQGRILIFERNVEELTHRNNSFIQQCAKLKDELEDLKNLKYESENQLNQELQNIKSSSDEEKSVLNRELSNLRATADSERVQLNRKNQELQESLEKLNEELQAKVSDLNADKDALVQEIEKAKLNSRDCDSSMKKVVDEFKENEAKLSAQLDEQRIQTDEARKTLESLTTSKDLLRSKYEEKLQISQNKILKLEADLVKAAELQKFTVGENEDKFKVHNDLEAQLYERDQKIIGLSHHIENEASQKKKLEESLELLKKKHRELEDEQVDLVDREEQLKNEKQELQENVDQLKELQKSIEEMLKLEKKASEVFKTSTEEKFRAMEDKIGEQLQVITSTEAEKQATDDKLRRREEEVAQLQSNIKSVEATFEEKTKDTHSMLKQKDDKLTTLLDECSSKQVVIDGLKNNLENFQSCLKSSSSEKEMSLEMVQKLTQDISARDSEIREFKMKIYEVEKANKELEGQMQNILGAKSLVVTQSEAQISDLQEQIQILEQVKHEEVENLSLQLSSLQKQLKLQENASESSTTSLKMTQKRENDLLLALKDAELREAELLLSNQTLKRKLEEQESSPRLPQAGEAYDKEMTSHIEFLNSIISDMHNKNLKLQQKVDLLGAGPTSSDASGNSFGMDFLSKKKPAPRPYCDICEEFDKHETEDCPLQSSGMDEPAPKEKKVRKLPPPRLYCDYCEEFDLHDSENCLNNEEETY